MDNADICKIGVLHARRMMECKKFCRLGLFICVDTASNLLIYDQEKFGCKLRTSISHQ